MTQALDFCIVQDALTSNTNFWQNRLKLAMIRSMGWNKVSNRQHNFHNVFKFQSSSIELMLLGDAAKFHIKLRKFGLSSLFKFY
jgi:hypothetical protein